MGSLGPQRIVDRMSRAWPSCWSWPRSCRAPGAGIAQPGGRPRGGAVPSNCVYQVYRMTPKLLGLFCSGLVSLLMAASAVPQKSRISIDNPARLNAPQIWVTTGLYQPWDHPPPNPPAWWARRTDGWEMFTEVSTEKWQQVLDKTSVIALTGNSIQAACLEKHTKSSPRNCSDLGVDQEKSLDHAFRFLKAHHIKAALEVGLLVDTQLAPSSTLTRGCGTEAFIKEDSLTSILQKIREAGGSLDFIRMDEPFWYGTMSCHDTARQVAKDISLAIRHIVESYFPDVQIGDVEPVTSSPKYPALLGRWADAYREATGRRLAFFQADPDWGNELIFRNLVDIASVMKARFIPFGIMYTSQDDSSDLDWTQSAIGHFTMAETYFHINADQADFQSWTKYPAFMLPEQKPGTLLNVAYQYLLPRTYLSMTKVGGFHGRVRIKLTDAERAPLAGAGIRIKAIDVQDSWPMADRIMRGTVPTRAIYGVIGIRANLEGSEMSADRGEADFGTISITSNGKTWRSNYAVPLKMQLSPTKTLLSNLSFTGATTCRSLSVIPLDAGASYTLSVPMSATASAAHAGYVTIVFLDGTCKGIKRDALYFSPSSEWLSRVPLFTNSNGEVLFSAPIAFEAAGAELRAYYGGDNMYHRPSLSVLESKRGQSESNQK